MLTTRQSLSDLTAADLMCREVVTLPMDLSLREAAHCLAKARVGGAPVVDASGHCIGVLTKSDLVRSLDEGAISSGSTEEEAGEWFADWQVVDFGNLPPDAVARHMSADAVTARPDTPVRELAKLMCAFRIHRVVITSPENHVLGVVSSLDVVGAIAPDPPEGP